MTSADDEVARLPSAPDAIELRHLRAFVAVAEELNFARAAAGLYLSAPALSRQIRALERLLGCELFRRNTHQVELTLSGEALMNGARDVLAAMDGAVSATQAVGGELAGRIAQFWAPTDEWFREGSKIQRLRNDAEKMMERFSVPAEVRVRSVVAGGVSSLVLSESDSPATILYLHGGVYVMGSAYGFRAIAGALSAAAGSGVLLPDYRLAPEHPYPAAVIDAVRAYEWILAEGVPPHQVAIVGESSGAGLVMSTLLRLRADGQPLPGAAALLSPAVDLSGAALADFPKGIAGAALELDELHELVDAYLDGVARDDPRVSPLHADLTGLPPLLIQAGTGDPFLADARQLADRARAHGLEVTFDAYPADTHSFQLFWSFLPEGADAVRDAGTFIRRHTAQAATA